LTKGLQVSRHERNKSKTGYPGSIISEPAVEQLDTSPTHTQSNYNHNAFESTLTSQNAKSVISGNEGYQKPQGGHRRIPSYMKSIPHSKL
jgi:hypothetical protein